MAATDVSGKARTNQRRLRANFVTSLRRPIGSRAGGWLGSSEYGSREGVRAETAPQCGAVSLYELCRNRYGVAIFQRPRPCVAAMMYEPSGLNCRSFTDTFGSVPRRDQDVAAP